MYALLALLDSAEHEAVSIETQDDVVLHGDQPTLIQLKHRLANPPALTIRSPDIWKTIAIWASVPPTDPNRCLLVTTAEIANGSSLVQLLAVDGSRDRVESDLSEEANRVIEARLSQANEGKQLSFSDRAAGCEAYRALTPAQRQILVSRITIVPGSLTIDDIPAAVARRLATILGAPVSASIAERLIEWWDRRIVLSLLGRLSRIITKAELQARILDFIVEAGTPRLPDHFSAALPNSLDQELGGMMERQILLVRGGPSRVIRAARARWRARSQRERWMNEDASMASIIHDYDQHLLEEWEDRFNPMCDDCAALDAMGQCDAGLSMLEWSHLHAPTDLRPIQESWSHNYLIQGTYQQMAEELQVGWHPKFRDLLGEADGKKSD
ncbi:MAG TPA: ABC-three component system protein [Longimicrobium sp.]|nr:ABC-three component system protein [Longimicrobium sp.]